MKKDINSFYDYVLLNIIEFIESKSDKTKTPPSPFSVYDVFKKISMSKYKNVLTLNSNFQANQVIKICKYTDEDNNDWLTVVDNCTEVNDYMIPIKYKSELESLLNSLDKDRDKVRDIVMTNIKKTINELFNDYKVYSINMGIDNNYEFERFKLTIDIEGNTLEFRKLNLIQSSIEIMSHCGYPFGRHDKELGGFTGFQWDIYESKIDFNNGHLIITCYNISYLG